MTRVTTRGEGYSHVTVKVRRNLDRSIIVAGPDDGPDVVIGKSNLSLLSEGEVDEQLEFPVELELEIRTWLVKKEGLG